MMKKNDIVNEYGKTYPLNLIRAVVGRRYNEDYISGLQYQSKLGSKLFDVIIMNYLNDREQRVLIERYKNFKLFKEIDKIIECSTGRSRVIESTAIKKMSYQLVDLYIRILGTISKNIDCMNAFHRYFNEYDHKAVKIINVLSGGDARSACNLIVSNKFVQSLLNNNADPVISGVAGLRIDVSITGTKIEELGPQVCSYKILKEEGIHTVEELLSITRGRWLILCNRLGSPGIDNLFHKIEELGYDVENPYSEWYADDPSPMFTEVKKWI